MPHLRELVHLLIMSATITIAHSRTHTRMLLSLSFAGSIFGKPETHGSNHVLVETEVRADHGNWAAPLPSGSTCWTNRHVHTYIYNTYVCTYVYTYTIYTSSTLAQLTNSSCNIRFISTALSSSTEQLSKKSTTFFGQR